MMTQSLSNWATGYVRTYHKLPEHEREAFKARLMYHAMYCVGDERHVAREALAELTGRPQ